ncbi:MAG TPA: hypothetical protein VGY66_00970 [Gemmataceae bacterium]|jgi:hypothetical protein|nr:hypothetical protein [Gemmataceae bacterium]
MNRFASFLCRGLQIAMLACGIFFVFQVGHSQPPAARIGTVQETLPITRDWDKDAKEESKLFDAMQKGERPVSTDEDKTILENGAKWYTYRLTQPIYQEPGASSKGMHGLVKEAVSKIVDPNDRRRAPNANQIAFKEEFDKRLAARLAEVMRTSKVIARVNAAMILERLAATGDEEVVDILVETVQDPQENDGVKLFALRGLKEFCDLGQGLSAFRSKDREAKCIQALIDYVQHKPAGKQALSGSQAAALSYVRNEAVAALGATLFPAYSVTEKKKTTIQRTTALALLRVIRKDGVIPEPTLTEQVNAVVSLAQLQAKLCDEYQVDYAAYHVGRFIAEFVVRRNAGKDSMTEPWKVHAARLHQAVADLRTQAARGSGKAYVDKLASLAQTLLNDMVTNPKGTPDQRNLSTFLDTNPPASKSLFRGLDDAVVKEAEKTVEE